MTVEILINGKFSHAVRFLYLLTLKGGGRADREEENLNQTLSSMELP